ncbi:MAG: molybdopterin-guanine dinucleotide biosynthesis protein B [Bauldia sp.]|nr:molybdopterin-guanine dinucleotide biosynthesis protein B [Bauldia sp.]
MGVVGWQNSGKTTLITRLIPALNSLGLSVSTVKHVHHSIDLDQPGKDTFLHREAGAVDVAMVSDKRWAILHERREPADAAADLPDILRRLSPVDLVLVEGFKSLAMRRIEIRAEGATPISPAGDRDTIALVTDGPVDPALPTFRRDQIEPLASFLADWVRAEVLAS